MTSATAPTDNRTEIEAVKGAIAVISYAINPDGALTLPAGGYLTLRQLRAQFRDVVRGMERWIRETGQPVRQPCNWETFRQYVPDSAEFWDDMQLEDSRAALIAKYGIGAESTAAGSDS